MRARTEFIECVNFNLLHDIVTAWLSQLVPISIMALSHWSSPNRCEWICWFNASISLLLLWLLNITILYFFIIPFFCYFLIMKLCSCSRLEHIHKNWTEKWFDAIKSQKIFIFEHQNYFWAFLMLKIKNFLFYLIK